MTDVKGMITDLERQKAKIDRAILALREVDLQPGSLTRAEPSVTAPKKRKLSVEGRRRIIEATKRRWAAKRAMAEGTAAEKPAAVKRRGRKRASQA